MNKSNLIHPKFQSLSITMIETQEEWLKFCKKLEKQAVIAIDLESNGYHCYPEKICLIQLAFQKQIFIIDPIKIGELNGLKQVFENKAIIKIFHSCDNDIRALQRDYGIKVKSIFDTSLAAKFIGCTHLGLANVLNEIMEIDLDKNKKIQRQDWSRRPLDTESLQYAAYDVLFLHELKRLLERQLIGLGRLTWFQEESKLLEKINYKEPTAREELFWNMKNIGLLQAKQRAILKELCIFRDGFARAINKPPYRLISDEALIELVNSPGKSFDKIRGLRNIIKYKYIKQFLQAIKRGRDQKGIPMTMQPFKHKSKRKKTDKPLLLVLKKWREKEAQRINVDPSVIWPMISLETLSGDPVSIMSVSSQKEVRKWQKKLYKKELMKLINNFKIENRKNL